MRWLSTIFRAALWALAGLLLFGAAWLALMPPELLRVGTGYAAKIVCSNVFVAGRSADEVLADDVQAPGNPLLRLVGVRVDAARKTVTAVLAGVFVPQTAVYREGLGCAVVADGRIDEARRLSLPAVAAKPADQGMWPFGEAVAPTDARLAPVLSQPALTGAGMRAVVVVKDGRILGEAYGAGFGPATPLLGWSMTKTVNAAIIGRLIDEGRMALSDKALFAAWNGDGRREIAVSDLMAMQSGLEFNEDYGTVADVTRMLFLEPDMAAFAADKPAANPPGRRFRYSSGTAVLLSRLWMDQFADRAAALGFPRAALFGPLGMTSAVMEPDAHGTFVGSSYLYASARDWARFGQLLIADGIWNGTRLLPEGFVKDMATPTEVSRGAYTRLQAWHVGPGGGANAAFDLPDDAFWLQGHDGQSIAIIPSERLVVVRLGLTPYRAGYEPQRLVAATMKALR